MENGASPGPGPIKRVIAGSFGTGAFLMIILTLGPAAGAREYVITAMTLLGFGSGWAMLALLSDRLTDRPQRWAFVPAAAMLLTAVALMVVAPGDAELTRAGWVWPPLLFLLTIWMARQSALHLVGVERLLVAPVLGVLAITCGGGAYESVALARDARAFPRSGDLYDVGGYRLHLECTGTGSPAVVLLSGLGEMSPYWSRIAPAIATTTRVCAYDRAGQGWSESSPHVPDGTRTARDLHALLNAAQEEGPFVLVGHSSGGVYALNYAANFPDQVAGVVLLDSSSPRQPELVPSFAASFEDVRRLVAILPTAARLGLGRLAPSPNTLPPPAAAQVAMFASSSRGFSNQRDEQEELQAAMRQAQMLTTLGDRPLIVLTTRDELEKTSGWGVAQDQLATLSTNSSHRIVDVTHAAVLDDPSSAAVSAQAIDDVVRSARTHAPLQTR